MHQVASQLITTRLPEENYCVLKFIVTFLVEVVSQSVINKMTSSNLSIVFGPNLLWPEGIETATVKVGGMYSRVCSILSYQLTGCNNEGIRLKTKNQGF